MGREEKIKHEKNGNRTKEDHTVSGLENIFFFFAFKLFQAEALFGLLSQVWGSGKEKFDSNGLNACLVNEW